MSAASPLKRSFSGARWDPPAFPAGVRCFGCVPATTHTPHTRGSLHTRVGKSLNKVA